MYEKAKCTKNVGIVVKYGTGYGTSLRKMVEKIEISQHGKYACSFCGKTRMMKKVLGLRHFESCMKTFDGGVWTYNITLAVIVKSAIKRLKEMKGFIFVQNKTTMSWILHFLHGSLEHPTIN
ncbi:60S ribosomal protein L37a-like [Ictalurus furcatus]|uniref:60S ribosomal protein L37a-like n=1 Tax=Ictalurus furcatus TaxID=66913 RepID=UPI0023505939|nr:60S ribosomal protein L37a-like [Ictalurus furcatus]